MVPESPYTSSTITDLGYQTWPIDRTILPVSEIQLNDGFFVPAYPLFMVLVPYGLFLTFSSYLCPTTCIPSFLPLGPLATFLGTNFNFLMGSISAIAAALHVGESIQAWYLSLVIYKLNRLSVILWTLNVFFFGIFGFWPLAFPATFYSVKDAYCSFPGATCFNV